MKKLSSGRLFVSLMMLSSAVAQEFRATLSGRVLDSQNAVVPEVAVTAIQIETGAKFETRSGQDGQYTLPFLPPAEYRLVAEAGGFKKAVRDGIRMGTGERVSIDIVLEIGQLAESVSVTAEAPMLTTTTASTGQVISSRQVENMPLNGRTALTLAQLAFGVTPSSDPRFYRPFDNDGPSGMSIGGAVNKTNELLLDGIPNTTADGRVAYNPPVDSVEEVKVDVFQADAAYGHTEAAPSTS